MSEIAGWLGREAERTIETSVAWVFLFPDRTLKLKKPVDFGFLDFTRPEQRRWACERELAFNRETAPDLYRCVRTVTRAGDAYALDGAGEAVDWVVEMRRFADGAVLAEAPARVDGALGETLGREVARFHIRAKTSERSGRDCLAYVLKSNAGLLRKRRTDLGAEAVQRLAAASDAAFQPVADLLQARSDAGLVRRCHGDLHLGNIMVEPDAAPVLFDCVEFNDTLGEIDVLYDLAFLLMDLGFRGIGEAANRAMNGWLDEAARSLPQPALWTGLAALPLFQSVRAAVRTHVTVNQGEADLARRYLAAAEAHLRPVAPRLTAVGGYSGSGKTGFARQIAPELGRAPGAVVLRSDEVRKRLWGRGPLDRLPTEAYAAGTSEPVYAALFDTARLVLAAGQAVVLDAAFLRADERAAAEAVASEAGVAFDGVWMTAPPETLRARVAARTGDASDADVAVLERQLTFDVGEVGWRRHG